MGRAKVVEINGRKYDAATGKLIKNTSTQTSGGSIDGVVKSSKSSNQLHSTPSKSKTLNRKAVSKSSTVKKKSTAQKKTIHRPKQAKSQAHQVDKDRNKRAQATAKSSLISKFSKSKAEKKEEPAPEKVNTGGQKFTSSKYSPKKSNAEKDIQPKKKKTKRFKSWASTLKRPKAVSVFAGAAVVALLAAYVTYLNIPNLSLRIAASRAGIDATLPGYKPSGFSLAGPINYSDGIVTINFNSNTDDRNFNIVERDSSWDSQSLLANYVERETPNYVTFQDRGLTIYVYNGSNATWVDSGIWYTIEGESQLNSDQLLKIAASM